MTTVDSKKIKVLFVIVQMGMGGSEHLVWDLIRSLDRSRFSPYLAWFYGEKPLQQFVDLNIPLFHIPKIRRLDLSTMRQVGKLIQEHQIDVVNAHHYLSLIYSFYGCKLANRIGLIYTEHSLWEIKKISPKWQFVGRRVLPFADVSVGISAEVRAGLKSIFHLTDKQTCTIVNGVDCQLLAPPEDKKHCKQKLGFSEENISIGMVANLKKNKNHIFLLKAFRQLLKEHPQLNLFFVGQGFEGDLEGSEEEIQQYIAEHNLNKNVSLLGARADVPDILKALDIFCLTSYQEGLPISLIEAMASGLPVVGTNVAGIKGVIDHDVNGFLVEPDNEEQLSASLHKLVADSALRLRFGKKSRELATTKYSLNTCMNQYQNIFQDCC